MEERYIKYEERLTHMYNFLNIICIEGGLGCDLKDVSRRIILGQYTFEEAINEWKRLGHYTLA